MWLLWGHPLNIKPYASIYSLCFFLRIHMWYNHCSMLGWNAKDISASLKTLLLRSNAALNMWLAPGHFVLLYLPFISYDLDMNYKNEIYGIIWTWWRHQIETFSVLLAHLCGEFTGLRCIPRTKASDAELWCFLWSASVCVWGVCVCVGGGGGGCYNIEIPFKTQIKLVYHEISPIHDLFLNGLIVLKLCTENGTIETIHHLNKCSK